MSLLERFQSSSRFNSVGEFTIDESKAKIKMATFQLASKSEFLMLIAAAAVIAQTSAIVISQSSSLIEIEAQSVSLDPEAIDDIESSLLDSSEENKAYNLLAVAVNAIAPSCSTSPKLELTNDNLHLTVHLSSPLSKLQKLLEERLAYLPCPLELNKTPIPTHNLNNTPILSLELDPRKGTELKLVHYGVVMPLRSIQNSPISFSAVVPADHLKLDASFSEVLEDKSYQKLIIDLDNLANSALRELALNHAGGGANNATLLTYLQKNLASPAREALQDCPLFPLGDRPSYISLNKLKEAKATYGKLFVASPRYGRELNFTLVLVENSEIYSALKAFFPESCFSNAQDEYKKQLETEERQRAWKNSPRATELPPGKYLIETKVKNNDWEAALGFLSAPSGTSSMDVLFQGKLLASEPINGAPPGAVAVLNVLKGEVDGTWSHLEGKSYRAILKEIDSKLNELFAQIQSLEREDLSKSLEDYLLGQLQKSEISTVAETAPLFKTTTAGRFLSISEIKKLPRIALGNAVKLSPAIPSDLVANPLILFTPSVEQLLYSIFGKNKVEDQRQLQERLLNLAQSIERPRPARLSTGQTEFRATAKFKSLLGEGQLGLTNKPGSILCLHLMSRGAVFEQVSLDLTNVVQAEAVISTDKLSLKPDWSGFVRDSSFKLLINEIKEQLARLEESLITNRAISSELRSKLLASYPQPDEALRELLIFPTTQPGQFVSINTIDEEKKKYGVVLQDGVGIQINDRIVLQPVDSAMLAIIEKFLGPIKWQQASEIIRLENAEAEFYKKGKESSIRLDPNLKIMRISFSEDPQDGEGEVALAKPQSEECFGYVDCYVDNRLVCRKAGLIPKLFVAAIQSPLFKLNEDFTDVDVPRAVRDRLEDRCNQLMLRAAASKTKHIEEAAWVYFSKKTASSSYLEKFIASQEIELLDGSMKPLNELKQAQIRGYSPKKISWYDSSKGLVLLLDKNKAKMVATLLKKELKDVSQALTHELKQRDFLKGLPTGIDQDLKPEIFTSQDFSAEIAISSQRYMVGMDSNGKALGYLPSPLYPIIAIVKGAKKSEKGVAAVPVEKQSLLDSWIEKTCLYWLNNKADVNKPEHHQMLVELLHKTMRNIGSTGSTLAQIAQALWDLPLFKRVDKTKVSGAALASALTTTKEPIIITSSTFITPGPAIYIQENSLEYKILASRLGKDSLQWYERPYSINYKEIGKSIQRMANWEIHLPNFSFITSSLKGFIDSFSEDKDKSSKQKPRIAKLEKDIGRNTAGKSTEERMILDLQEDVKNVVGRNLFERANGLFQKLEFGRWPLGPAVYPKGPKSSKDSKDADGSKDWRDWEGWIRWKEPKDPKKSKDDKKSKGSEDAKDSKKQINPDFSFRLNLLHPGIRWMMSTDGSDRSKRVARTLLAILWVSLVNEESEQFKDKDEDKFIDTLGKRLVEIYGSESK